MIYKDSHGVTIKEGDILKYEELSTKAIDEVVSVKGELYTRTHVTFPRWTKQFESVVIPIQCSGELWKLDNTTIQLKSFKIIGDITTHPDRLEPAYAEALWGE